MKRCLLTVSLLLAVFQAACSGGGGSSTLPPPVGGFSKSDLNGQYAFTMVGNDPLGNVVARIGVFVADGNGNIQGGIEDVDVGAGDETLTFNAGTTYTMSADGRGEINLTNSTTGSTPLIFSVTLVSPTQGFIVQTDGNATTSGTFALQNTNAFTLASLSASYVFDFAGISPDQTQNFLPDSLVGQFTLSSGALQGGVLDENFAAQLSGPLTIDKTNGITFDATNGSTFGRGTLAFFADSKPQALTLACRVADWTIDNMQAADGHFYYRDLGWTKIKTPMFHWGQGTMFKALAHLLNKLDGKQHLGLAGSFSAAQGVVTPQCVS